MGRPDKPGGDGACVQNKAIRQACGKTDEEDDERSAGGSPSPPASCGRPISQTVDEAVWTGMSRRYRFSEDPAGSSEAARSRDGPPDR